jgi:hypothetical protein
MDRPPHDRARLDAEAEAALARIRDGGAGLDVDLAGTLEDLEDAPTAWRPVATRRFVDALADAGPPQAAVTVAAVAVLMADPATALGAFPTTVAKGGRWRLTLAGWGHLDYQVDEGQRTVELLQLDWT